LRREVVELIRPAEGRHGRALLAAEDDLAPALGVVTGEAEDRAKRDGNVEACWAGAGAARERVADATLSGRAAPVRDVVHLVGAAEVALGRDGVGDAEVEARLRAHRDVRAVALDEERKVGRPRR